MFSCLRAREVWKSLGLEGYIEQTLKADRSGSCVPEHVLCRTDGRPVLGMLNLHEIVAVACWHIWWQRREIVKGEKVADPCRTAFAINSLTANYFAASSDKALEKEIIWKRPAKGCLKLNTDASFFMDGTGAAGVVLRNDRGEAIAGYACPLDHVLNASTAEALALLEGLKFLENLGVTRVITESDSLEIIQACNAVIEVWSPFSAILAECFMKAHSLDSVEFIHCPREANQVAHQLAKFSYSSNSVLSWDGEPPEFIFPFVINDVTLLASK